MLMSVFRKLPPSLCKARDRGYLLDLLRMIFYVEGYLRRKTYLFIGGNVVDFTGKYVYSRTTNMVLGMVLLTITA